VPAAAYWPTGLLESQSIVPHTTTHLDHRYQQIHFPTTHWVSITIIHLFKRLIPSYTYFELSNCFQQDNWIKKKHCHINIYWKFKINIKIIIWWTKLSSSSFILLQNNSVLDCKKYFWTVKVRNWHSYYIYRT